jgi:hypothetical protein
MAQSESPTSNSAIDVLAWAKRGGEPQARVRKPVACEWRDAYPHIGPQRQADNRLVEFSRVAGGPDRAVRESARYAPNRAEHAGVSQGPPALGFCRQQRRPVVVVEIRGQLDIDFDEEFHERELTRRSAVLQKISAVRQLSQCRSAQTTEMLLQAVAQGAAAYAS